MSMGLFLKYFIKAKTPQSSIDLFQAIMNRLRELGEKLETYNFNETTTAASPIGEGQIRVKLYLDGRVVAEIPNLNREECKHSSPGAIVETLGYKYVLIHPDRTKFEKGEFVANELHRVASIYRKALPEIQKIERDASTQKRVINDKANDEIFHLLCRYGA
jgi:hypothetical protein